MWILVIPGQFLLAVLTGVLAPRRLGWLGIVLGLAMPWTLPRELVALRGFSALLSVAICMRSVDLARENPPRPWLIRAAHAVSPSDLRLAKWREPTVHIRYFVVGGAFTACALGSFWIARSAGAPWTALALAQRWGGSLAGLYLAFEGLDRVLQATYLLFGLAIEPTQRNPILSRTVAEFWGVRWNSIVRRWLASVTFFRMWRRRPIWGIVGAFIVSAAVHAEIIWPALGWKPALWMGLFFLVHGGIVVTERRLRVARWPRAGAYTWTLFWFFLTMPLFMEPFLGLFSFPPALDFVCCGT